MSRPYTLQIALGDFQPERVDAVMAVLNDCWYRPFTLCNRHGLFKLRRGTIEAARKGELNELKTCVRSGYLFHGQTPQEFAADLRVKCAAANGDTTSFWLLCTFTDRYDGSVTDC